MNRFDLINETKTRCTHCGNDCIDDSIKESDHTFCCSGCLVVYQLLTKHNLSSYYNFEQFPGIEIKSQPTNQYAYLDDENVVDKLLLFNENGLAKVSFKLPQIPVVFWSRYDHFIPGLPKSKCRLYGRV